MKIALISTVAAGTVALLGAALATDAVLTADEQAALSPDQVLKDLMAGNKRFVAGELEHKDIVAEVKALTEGQFPQAIILSCVDSRVPVELVFDQNIGNIFVARVAGNFENGDILGSMEFATKAAGAKLVMVLGHESCGAVKGACDGVELGNLTGLLANIKPAVAAVEDGFAKEQRTSKNKAFVDAVTLENIKQTVKDIRTDSPVLAELEKEGKVKIVGALYDIHDGSVSLVEE